jgi:hypothetical protein
MVDTSGSLDFDIWIGQFDSGLNLQNSKIIDGPNGGADAANDIIVDGTDVYVTGFIDESTGRDIWIAKYDISLNLISSTTYAGPSTHDEGTGIASDGAGSIYITGYITTASQGTDVWIGKYNSDLEYQNSTTYNGSASSNDSGKDILVDGSYLYVVGYVNETVGGVNVWVAKYNTTPAWQAADTFNNFGTYSDIGYDITTWDGDYYIAAKYGSSNPSLHTWWIARYNSSMNRVDELASYTGIALGIASDGNGNFYVAGFDDMFSGEWDICISKYNSFTIIPTGLTKTALGVSSITWNWDDQVDETGYRVISSTDWSVSGDVSPSIWTETGLSTNTYYNRRIVAFNSYGASTSTALECYTHASVPEPSDTSNIMLTRLQANWNTNGNPAGTTYYVVISSMPSPNTNGLAANQSSTTVKTNASFTGLTQDTTYYTEIKAFNHDNISTAFAGSSTPTAKPPSNFSGTAAGISSITWSWSDARSENVYRINNSIDGNESGDVAENETSWTETALSTNTFYSRKIIAVFGIEGSTSALSDCYTKAAVPEPADFSGVAFTQMQVNWNTNGNPAGTTYYVVISSVSSPSTNGLTNQSSTTVNTNAFFTGLNYSTTYFAEVKAINHANISTLFADLGSTRTAIPPTIFAAIDIGISSITWLWTDGDGEEGYRVLSWPGLVDQSGDIAANQVTWADTGLSTNTYYERKLQAFIGADSVVIPDNPGVTTMVSLPAPAGFSIVSPDEIRVDWSPEDNPAWTTYDAVISTGVSPSTNGFTGTYFSSSVSLGVATYMLFSGLTPDTTYYFEARTLNYILIPTPYVDMGSTRTPRSPVNLAGNALGVSSITWSWSDGEFENGYRIISSTDLSANLSPDLSADEVSWIETGLSTNTYYSRHIVSLYGSYGSTTTVFGQYTLAATPSTNLSVGGTSYIMANIIANSNPPGTTYYAVLSSGTSSSTNGFSGNKSSTTTNNFASFKGLNANTTYYVQIKAINHSGISTLYSTESASTTIAAQPSTAFSTDIGIDYIKWSWPEISGTLKYKVYASSNFSLLDGNVISTSYTLTNLPPNEEYGIVYGVVNAGGESVLSPTNDVWTLAAAPDSFEFLEVNIDSITVQWTDTKNSTETIKYQLDYWAQGTSTETTTNFTANEYTAITLKENTTYYFRIRSVNRDAIPTNPGITISAVTKSLVFIAETIDTGTSKTLRIMLPSGEISVNVPAYTFDESVEMTILTQSSFADDNSAAADLTGTKVGIDITIDKSLQPQKNITITIYYRDSDVTGLDENKLIIARYDETGGVWVPLASTPDPANNNVVAYVKHLSIFQIMQVNASNTLSTAKVFPNPFMPSAAGHTSITFSDIPANSTVRIYTFSGQLVKELTASGTGIAGWDATNSALSDVSSGVYLVLIESNGEKKIVKVAIQR